MEIIMSSLYILQHVQSLASRTTRLVFNIMNRGKTFNKKLLNGFVLVLTGLQLSQRGPAFIDLILISGTDVEGGSIYITCANVIYITGTLLAGVLYARVKDKSLAIAVSIILASVFITLTPWCTHFATMLLALSLSSILNAIYETIVDTEQIRISGGKSESPMQFLSFCYSLGGIIGPLITEPFLAPKQTSAVGLLRDDDSLNGTHPPDSSKNVSFVLLSKSFEENISIVLGREQFYSGGQSNESLIATNTTSVPITEFRIRYAFLITGLLGLVTAIPFFIMSFKYWRTEEDAQETNEVPVSTRKLPPKIFVLVTSLGCLYYFLFSAVDDGVAQFLALFVVKQLDWSKEDGALVSSLYWGINTCVKLALIPLSTRIPTGLLLFVTNIFMVFSFLAFMVACLHHQHTFVWICTVLVSTSLSAVYGGGMSWLDTNILELDGFFTAILIISAALGASVVPIPIGVLMSGWTPMAFAYILLVLSIITLLVFIVLLFLIKPFILKNYGPPRPNNEIDAVQPNGRTETANGALLCSENVPSVDVLPNGIPKTDAQETGVLL